MAVFVWACFQTDGCMHRWATHGQEPEGIVDYVDEAMSMSYKTRLIAFAITLATGIFFTCLSTFLLPLILIKPHKFAIAYTLGTPSPFETYARTHTHTHTHTHSHKHAHS